VKFRGANTDHAADQKKLTRLIREWHNLCKRELCGEQSLLSMLPHNSLPILLEATERAIVAAGGYHGWEKLSSDEKITRNLATCADICRRIGEEEFMQLSDQEKSAIDWFVWVGCCMHKELNTVKGGAARFPGFWARNNLPGPVKLMNRDNDAAAALGGEARERAEHISQGGAIKLTSLAGDAFNNRDDKRGHQDTYKYFMEDSVGCLVKFPDTSNTRFQSHCEAASVLLLYQELFIEFLHLIKHKKDSHALNHMEANVLKGLEDLSTIHELCVLSLFSQVVSHPYMHCVHRDVNALTLGPLHRAIAEFMKKIIANPELLLSPQATYETGSFDGKP